MNENQKTSSKIKKNKFVKSNKKQGKQEKKQENIKENISKARINLIKLILNDNKSQSSPSCGMLINSKPNEKKQKYIMKFEEKVFSEASNTFSNDKNENHHLALTTRIETNSKKSKCLSIKSFKNLNIKESNIDSDDDVGFESNEDRVNLNDGNNGNDLHSIYNNTKNKKNHEFKDNKLKFQTPIEEKLISKKKIFTNEQTQNNYQYLQIISSQLSRFKKKDNEKFLNFNVLSKIDKECKEKKNEEDYRRNNQNIKTAIAIPYIPDMNNDDLVIINMNMNRKKYNSTRILGLHSLSSKSSKLRINNIKECENIKSYINNISSACMKNDLIQERNKENSESEKSNSDHSFSVDNNNNNNLSKEIHIQDEKHSIFKTSAVKYRSSKKVSIIIPPTYNKKSSLSTKDSIVNMSYSNGILK